MFIGSIENAYKTDSSDYMLGQVTIDAKVIVDHAISNIVADAKKTFGSSSDMSLYD